VAARIGRAAAVLTGSRGDIQMNELSISDGLFERK
jgi:hypothetical protein